MIEQSKTSKTIVPSAVEIKALILHFKIMVHFPHIDHDCF